MKIRLLSLLLMWVLTVPAWADSAVSFGKYAISYRDGRLTTVRKHRKVCSTPVVGRIISISASDRCCVAATADGQLYLTSDGKSWKMSDFNALYSEYYGQVTVRCICACHAGIMLAGVGSNGQPVAFESAEGVVWSERELTYTMGNSVLMLEELPVGLTYDQEHERFVMACTGNVFFYLPGCSHCNSIERL